MWEREPWDPKEITAEGRPVEVTDVRREVVLAPTPDPSLVRGYVAGDPGTIRASPIDPRGAVLLDEDQRPEAPATFLDLRTEPGDVVDLAITEDESGRRVMGVWFHVWYVNEHLRSEYRASMPGMKRDSLFAARTNPARRAEHLAANELLAPAGHQVEALHRPDDGGVFRFVIDYAVADRRRDTHDLSCARCGRSFEVKLRLRDDRRRVSHSRARPFWNENAPDDFHVFRYRRAGAWEVLSNREIAAALKGKEGTGRPGEADRWADIGRRGDASPRPLAADAYDCISD